MNIPSIIITLVVFLVLVLIVRKIINDKKNNVSSCGGACKNCPNAALCHGKKLKNDTKDK